MKKNKIVCASFFAGIGGIELGFKQAGFKTVYANEFNQFAKETYELNHNIKIDDRDIHDVPSFEIPDFNILLAGFPCQPFSIAGLREGFEDKKGRGNLFFELIRIIKDKNPNIIFLENVKGLLNHDDGNTFITMLNELQKLGYYIKWEILNTRYYSNIPQNRERIYIVGFKDEKTAKKFKFPEKTKELLPLNKVIDFESKMHDKYYYTEDNFKYFRILQDGVKRSTTVYQWRRSYVRENKSNVCPTLTSTMGGGGHNVPIILTKHGIRKLTPRECFNLQGFPKTFQFPKYMADMHLYNQIGNSVSIPVVKEIAKKIKTAIE